MSNIVELRPKSIPARLREASRDRTLIRLWRDNLEPGSFTGYVAALGRDRFLLWTLGDHIGFDGYFVLRYRDVTRLQTPDQDAQFLERAIALRGLNPEWPTTFPLDDMSEAIQAAQLMAPVITVYLDTEAETETVYVGRLLAFEQDGFSMQEISTNAEWLQEPSAFGFDEVSALSMHEPYALALAEVAGPPPQLDHTQPGHGGAKP